jgi:hypothetical protein
LNRHTWLPPLIANPLDQTGARRHLVEYATNLYWLANALACYAFLAASFVRRRMPVIGLYVAPIAIVALAMGASTISNPTVA